jgi:nucleoside-diphosphate-sugar epimerase
MRVLVTGGTGFIGSHTVVALQRAGHQLRLLARTPEKVARTFAPHGIEIDDVVAGDVVDPDAVAKALEGCEAVLHAAAVVALESSRAREVLDTNRRAVELVVGGAHERGIERIVYVSSLSALFHSDGNPMTVDSPLGDGENAYMRSKTDAERWVRTLEAAGAPISICYPPGMIGPDDPGLSEGNHMLRAFLKDTMVDTSSGISVFDVRDLARIHARMLEPNTPVGRFLVPGHYLPWPEAIALMDELTGRRVRRVKAPGGLLRFLGRLGDVVKRVYPFDFPLTHEAMSFASQWPGAVPSPEVQALGLEFRDVRSTYSDAIQWLYRTGHLTSVQAGRLAQ